MSESDTIYSLCTRLYHLYERESKDGVWEGSKTSVFSELNVSVGYYSMVNRMLVDMGCVTQEQRGNSHRGSRLQLHKPPTRDLYDVALDTRASLATLQGDERDELAQRVSVLESRMPDIDLPSFIVSLDERLGALHDRVDYLVERLDALEGR